MSYFATLSSTQLAPTLGQKTMAGSTSIAIASDQSLTLASDNFLSSTLTSPLISATGTYGPVQATPNGFYLISVGKTYTAATISFTSSGGAAGQNVITTATTPASIAIGQQIVGTGIPKGSVVTAFVTNTSVTISLPLTATSSGTVTLTSDLVSFTFQSSVDGSTFQNLSSILLSNPSLQTPASTQYYSGIYFVRAPVGLLPSTSIRLVVNTLTNATLKWYIDAYQQGQTITLPLNQPNAFTQANWPTGACVLPLIDRTFFREFTFDVPVFSGTSQTVTYYQSDDTNFAAPQGSYHVQQTSAGGGTGSSYTGVGIYKLKPVTRYFCTVETGTALTGWTMYGGASISSSPDPELSVYVNGSNLTQVASTTPTPVLANGQTNRMIGVAMGTCAANTDQSATAFAGAGRVNGTVVSTAYGGGVSIASDISITSLTLGSATSAIPVLQESYDSGTTFTDMWVGFPMTSATHQRMPAIPIQGRRRWCMHSIGGTSTTITTTIISQELPGVNVLQRQFVDVYNAINPFSTVINGATYTSTLVSTVLSSTGSVAVVEGCKILTISGVFTGGIPSVAPVYTLLLSQDATNWAFTQTTLSPTGAGTFMSSTTNNICARYAKLYVSTASSGGTPYGVLYTAINGTN